MCIRDRADDELMMKYLDGEEQLTQDELEQLLDKAIAQELFIPVFVGSTIIEPVSYTHLDVYKRQT